MVDGDTDDETLAPPKPHSIKRAPGDLKAEARSLKHLLTHHPKNPHCEVCRVAKLTRRPARRNRDKPSIAPKKFGEVGNADYVVAQSKEAMGLTGERDALVVVDRADPPYVDAFPMMSRCSSDAYGALREFYGDIALFPSYCTRTMLQSSFVRART